MKRFIPVLCVILAICSTFVLTACGKVEFSVNFIVEGEVYATINTGGNEIIKMPNNPTKEGYAFDGWYWDENTWTRPFTANSLMDAPLSSDMNVYAKWTTPDSVHGTNIEISSFEQTGEYEYSITVPNQTAMISLGNYVGVNSKSSWTLSTDIAGNNTIASKTATLAVGDNYYYILVAADNGTSQLYTVKIRRKPIYNVIFDTVGGSPVSKQEIEEGSLAVAPTTEKVGYAFLSWSYDFSNPITDNVIAVARWNANIYKIDYNTDDGTNNVDNPLEYTIETSDIVLRNPSKSGYSFGGWYTSANFAPETKITKIEKGSTADVVLYAKWVLITYSVQFDSQNGTAVENQTVPEGELLPSPQNPVREEFVFTGWYKDKECKTLWDFDVDKVTENTVLYAGWQKEVKILSVIGADIQGTDITMNYDVTTDLIDLSDLVKLSVSDANWKLSFDKSGNNEINSKTLSGRDGDYSVGKNVLYIIAASADGFQSITYTLELNIKYQVALPVQDQTVFTYNGNLQTYYIEKSDYYTVGNAQAMDAGTYTVTISLKNKNDYFWSNGNSEDITYSFVINKATVKMPEQDKRVFEYTGEQQTYIVADDLGYAVLDNAQINAGKYVVTITLRDKYNYTWETGSSADLKYDFVINRKMIAIPKANDSLFVYNGNEQEYTLENSNDYSLSDNIRKDAGRYSVTVRLNDDKNYEWADGKTDAKTYSFVIAKADVTDIVFNDENVEYDGKVHFLRIGGILPEGITVEYSGNGNVTKGTYNVVARFTNNNANYNDIKDMNAVLTITPQIVPRPAADNTVFTYNGLSQTYSLIEDNRYDITGTTTATNAGVNVITVSLKDDFNYVWDNDTTAALNYNFVINSFAVSRPVADQTIFTYNGESQTYQLATSELYVISGNVQTNAGGHIVTVSLNDKDNYVWNGAGADDLTFSFIIEKQSVAEPAADQNTFTYNGENQTYQLATDSLYAIKGNVKCYVGDYTVVVSLTDPDNYKWATSGKSNDLSYKFVIGKATYDMSGISFADATVKYDENAHSIYVTGDLPAGVTVRYRNNAQIEKGDYIVTAIFSGDDTNYYAISDMTATLTITRAEHTVTFRQTGKADRVYNVLDLASFTSVPTPIPVNGYDIVWQDVDLSRITADVVVNAIYTAKTYTISYVLNDGVNDDRNPNQYTVESQTITLYPASKTGYTFNGWSNGGKVESGSYGNKTFTANFTANTCDVIFNANGGSGNMSRQTLTYDQASDLFACSFVKTGYRFAGWATSAGGAVVYADRQTLFNVSEVANDTLDLYAKWTVNTYTVRFNANGGDGEMSSQSFTYDSAQNLSANAFEKVGYHFAGWTNQSGSIVYDDGQSVVNLTSTHRGIVDLYVVWSPNTYTLKFDSNDGIGVMSDQSIDYNVSQSISQNTFIKTGYHFIGWSTVPGGAVTYNDKAIVRNLSAEDGVVITLYAVWEANTYSVRFNANGGQGQMADQSFTYDQSASLAACDFSKTGYRFSGWAIEDGGDVVCDDTQVVKNLTSVRDGIVALYAVWTANTYKVSFNANGGEGSMSDQSFTYDKSKNLTANTFAKTGYQFAGWALTSTGAVAYADGARAINLTSVHSGVVELFAKWEANTYSVKFNANGATGTMPDQSFTYDLSQSLRSFAFAKTGYHFAGWALSADGDKIYDNAQSVINLTDTQNGIVRLYAVWVANQYYVRFNANGGDGSMSNQTLTYDAQTTLKANAYEIPAGYHAFLGWSRTSGGDVDFADQDSVLNLTAEENKTITLYAVWAANTYYVTFNANGGEGEMADQEFVYDVENGLDANEFTKTGYHFAGWAKTATSGVVYTDGQLVMDLTDEQNGVVQLYARWTANNYTVVFKANDGSDNCVSQNFTYDFAQELDENTFARAGYLYIGWSLSANGSVDYTDKEIVENLTAQNNGSVNLFAVWDVNSYKVIFHANNSTTDCAEQSFVYDHSESLDANTFTYLGYSFAGWAQTSTGNSIFDDEATVVNLTSERNGEYHLYAYWSLDIYAIGYELNDGYNAIANPASYTVYDEVTLANPSRAGYTFIGWSGTDLEENTIQPVISVGSVGDRAYTAHWSRVTIAQNIAEGGTISGLDSNKTYVLGDTVTVTASHSIGYKFVGWFEGEEMISENMLYSFTLTTDNKDYVAHFEICTEHIPDSDCICTLCGIVAHGTKDGAYCRHGDYVYFGEYPQTKVTDSATLTALNNSRGMLPTSANAQTWTDYGYYISYSVQSYMWYKDIELNGAKYRGVYFTSYRPYRTDLSSSTNYTYQDDHGYTTGNVYWFAYEPIKWRILTTSDGIATILCELAIDSQEYYSWDSSFTESHNGGTGYVNNYELSNIRRWLNNTFYNTAFNDMQKSIIQLTTVDNNTSRDNVFLLSYKETFETYLNSNAARRKKSTDYAKSQGCCASTDSSYRGDCRWWLRSPYDDNYMHEVRTVNIGGSSARDPVTVTLQGVVPALRIRL